MYCNCYVLKTLDFVTFFQKCVDFSFPIQLTCIQIANNYPGSEQWLRSQFSSLSLGCKRLSLCTTHTWLSGLPETWAEYVHRIQNFSLLCHFLFGFLLTLGNPGYPSIQQTPTGIFPTRKTIYLIFIVLPSPRLLLLGKGANQNK